MKRFMSLLLVIFLSFFGLIGCGSQSSNKQEQVDVNRTQVWVGNYNGGYGDEWLWQAKYRFEEKYKNEHFEPGKTGVQVMIDSNKMTYSGTNLLSTISGMQQEVFFSEMVFYYDYLSQGKVLEITDIVTDPLDEYGETRSIEDKLTEEQKSYFKADGKYYALPHYEAFQGLIYNVDLFEENNWYFSADPDNGNDGFVWDKEEARSAGPDGNPDTTYDNGLPATYEDFYRLCERIKMSGASPISWMGSNPSYVNMLLAALWTDYEGLEQVKLNYTLKGDAKNLVESINPDGSVVKRAPVPISNSNGYELYQQAGKYYALKFIETVVNNKYYSDYSFDESQSQTMAQADFLYSGKEPGNEVIAMLLDGSWWESEATPVFDEMVNIPGSSKKERRFALMPLPKAEKASKPTLMDTHMSASFINANIKPEKVEVAKLFLKFCHTDESLAEFTTVTGATKGFDYELTKEQYDSMSPYSQSLWTLRSEADVGRTFSDNEIYKSDQFGFWHFNGFNSSTSAGERNYPAEAIKYDKLTAEQYFEGMKKYYSKSYWDNKYSKFF